MAIMASPSDIKSDINDAATCKLDPSTVSAVSVKLPDFYTMDPEAWFLHAEAQFGLRGVCSDDTQYWQAPASSDAETAVRATCAASPAAPGAKYTTLKKFLTKAFSLLHWECGLHSEVLF